MCGQYHRDLILVQYLTFQAFLQAFIGSFMDGNDLVFVPEKRPFFKAVASFIYMRQIGKVGIRQFQRQFYGCISRIPQIKCIRNITA